MKNKTVKQLKKCKVAKESYASLCKYYIKYDRETTCKSSIWI